MGTVFKRPNGKFTAVGRPEHDDKGRLTRPTVGTFPTEREADEALARFEEGIRRGTLTMEAAALRHVPLSRYLDDWRDLIRDQQEAADLAPSTVSDYESVVRIHIEPYLGRVAIKDLNPVRIHRWLVRLRANGLSDRSVQKVYRCLHRAMGDAGLPANPVALPKHQRPRIRNTKKILRPTVEEVGQFLIHIRGCQAPDSERLLAFWRLAGVTGMRRSELCGLVWGDIDLDDGVVSIERGLHRGKGVSYHKAPKSVEGTREIAIDAGTVAALRGHRASQLEERMRAGGEYDLLPLGLDLVFRVKSGRPLNPDTQSSRFVKEWNHAGLRPGITMHGLRHGHGSILIAEGRPVTEVAARLGHSPEVLLRIYARDLDGDKRRAAMRDVTEKLYG